MSERAPLTVQVLGWVAAALLLLFFLLLKSFALEPSTGDEAIYFYDAAITAAGRLPYRDYTFAHPPLQVLALAPLYAIFGVSIRLGKLLPALLTVGTGVCTLLLGRRAGERAGGGPVAGWAAGLLALALLLTSFDLLRCSSHYTGANLGTFFAVLALERLVAGRPAQSGLATAAAALAGFYAAPAPVFAAFALLHRRRRELLRWVLACGGLFAAVNGVFLVLAPREYLDQVFLFHLAKKAHSAGNGPLWWALARDNLALVLTGALGTGLALAGLLARVRPWRWLSPTPASVVSPSRPLSKKARRRAQRQAAAGAVGTSGSSAATTPGDTCSEPSADSGDPLSEAGGGAADSEGPGLACVAGLLGQGLAVAALARVYIYYFEPALPLLAVLGGATIVWVGRQGLSALRARAVNATTVAAGLLLAVTVAGLLLLPGLLDPPRPQDQGRTKRYRWFGAPIAGPLSAAVRRIWWRDERHLDLRYPSLTRYLWHESRYSEAAGVLAERVRSQGGPDDLVFGDSMSAPVVALLAGRRLAGDLADTNRQHYWSGRRRAADDIASVDSPRLRWVVCRGRVGLCGEPAVQRWLDERFTLAVRVRETRRPGSLYLFERR